MKFSFFKPTNSLSDIGYKADQKGIMSRYLREKANWDVHLKSSSDYIIRFCELIPENSTLVVFGSGWLLDIPIEFLLSKFRSVYLIDMLHPVQVKHKFINKPNLKFLEKDLTGYVDDVARIVNDTKQNNIIDSLMNLPQSEVLAGIQYDVILSVNILTQLDSLLCDFISSRKYFPEEKLIQFQKKIQQEHLNLLSSRPSCLISDVAEIFLNRNNNVAYTTDSLKVNWPVGKHSENWNWRFDSTYSYNPRYKTNLSVKAEMLL